MMVADVVLDKELSNVELQTILSKIFTIRSEEIFVFEEWSEQVPTNMKLLCQRQILGGEFFLYISLYLQDYALEFINEFNLIVKICREAQCRALISDDSIDPFVWILVTEDGNQGKVSVCSPDSDFTITGQFIENT